jgi:hypothetical protein
LSAASGVGVFTGWRTNFPQTRWRGCSISGCLILNRRTDQAKAIFAKFPLETLDTIPARIASFLTRAAAGDQLEARLALTPQIESVAKATDMFPRFLAQGFALAGVRGPALKWLRRAIDRGFINYPFLARHDPSFKALRGDPKFKELLAVVRDRWEGSPLELLSWLSLAVRRRPVESHSF